MELEDGGTFAVPARFVAVRTTVEGFILVVVADARVPAHVITNWDDARDATDVAPNTLEGRQAELRERVHPLRERVEAQVRLDLQLERFDHLKLDRVPREPVLYT